MTCNDCIHSTVCHLGQRYEYGVSDAEIKCEHFSGYCVSCNNITGCHITLSPRECFDQIYDYFCKDWRLTND